MHTPGTHTPTVQSESHVRSWGLEGLCQGAEGTCPGLLLVSVSARAASTRIDASGALCHIQADHPGLCPLSPEATQCQGFGRVSDLVEFSSELRECLSALHC
eukprot:613950-Amphidinium_carterae.1